MHMLNQIVLTKKLTDRAVSPLGRMVEGAGGDEWQSPEGSTRSTRGLGRSRVAGGKEGEQEERK